MAPPLDCARATRLGTVKATTRCDPRRPPGQRLKRASPATALPSTLVRVNVVKQRLGGGGAVCHGRLRPAGKPSAEFQTTFMTSGVAPCFCRRACFLQCYFLRHSASQDVQSFASAAARSGVANERRGTVASQQRCLLLGSSARLVAGDARLKTATDLLNAVPAIGQQSGTDDVLADSYVGRCAVVGTNQSGRGGGLAGQAGPHPCRIRSRRRD